MTDLPALDVAGRLDRVRDAAAEFGVDALVVTSLNNVRWCTGFTGSFGALVVTADSAALLTDSRYDEQAPTQLETAGSSAEVIVTSKIVADGAAALASATAVGLEADAVSWADQRRWAEALPAEPTPTEALITTLRSVKDDAELARMQRAASIVDEALAEALPLLVEGTCERDLARHLEDGMRDRGASGPAYETIVASGPNAALPHARPGERRFELGDMVVIDAGSVVDAYRSDMTRTFVVGSADATAREIHAIATEAQAAGVAAVRPGIEVGEIDKVCRDLITEAGYGPQFGHGTGHGVGLDIHELPSVRAGNAAILQPGHVITVEPGIYLPGIGGVRVEDMVVVTDDGCRPLTRHPKTPLA
ncbi:MAG: Xaa-Pro peptidase family protein [Acidimicrobiales bacterium]|nr:Xaa-Pro peptidase family protein [Acidimicrobiales bacterium]